MIVGNVPLSKHRRQFLAVLDRFIADQLEWAETEGIARYSAGLDLTGEADALFRRIVQQ